MIRWPLNRCALLALLVFSSASSAGDLYVLLVCDTDTSNIGKGVQVDRANMRRVFESAYQAKDSPGNLYLNVLSGRDVTDKNIRKHLRALEGKIKDTDTLLFFYTGHGVETKFGNQRFQFHYEDPKLHPFRFDYEKLIDELKPRQKVMILHCCASRTAEAKQLFGDKENPFRPLDDPVPNVELFKHLFHEGQNWVIINSSSPNTPSWVNDKIGAFFTHVLTDTFCRPLDEFKRGDDGKVNWQSFFDLVKTNTARLERSQVPKAHYLNDCPQCDYFLRFANQTNDDLKLRVRFRASADPAKYVSKWHEYELPARGEVVLADAAGDKIKAHAFQALATSLADGRRWIHSTQPKSANQSEAGPVMIHMGIRYNAGKDGTQLRSYTHTFQN